MVAATVPPAECSRSSTCSHSHCHMPRWLCQTAAAHMPTGNQAWAVWAGSLESLSGVSSCMVLGMCISHQSCNSGERCSVLYLLESTAGRPTSMLWDGLSHAGNPVPILSPSTQRLRWLEPTSGRPKHLTAGCQVKPSQIPGEAGPAELHTGQTQAVPIHGKVSGEPVQTPREAGPAGSST